MSRTRNKKRSGASNQKAAASKFEKPNTTLGSTSSSSDDTQSKETTVTKEVQSNGINDPEWYKRFPELAFGSGNLPFGEQLGSSVKVGDISLVGTTSSNLTVHVDPTHMKNGAIPGVCSLVTKPSYGFNVDMNSPVNVAAQQFYTNVRYVNSGRKNYDPADLMMAEAAVADLYAFINWAQRIYGYAYMFSQRNLYIDEALIEANHVNAWDIREKLANFRYWLNTFISRVSSFAVPADINIFRRRAYMYAHLYTESTTMNIKDQLYQFVPDGFYRFELDGTGKGMLKYKLLDDWASTQWTVNNFITFGEHLLANIAGDEDFGLISGDIIKAYGSNILKLEPVPESLFIMPEYEEFTLSQMRNSDIIDVARGSNALSYHLDGNSSELFTTGDVMQAANGNIITAEGYSTATGDFRVGDIMALLPGIITVTNPMPSVDDVLEATRLKVCSWPTATDKVDNNDNVGVLATGSDVVTAVRIHSYGYDSNGVWKLMSAKIDSTSMGSTTPGNNGHWLFEHFHWAPIIWEYSGSTDSSGDFWIDWLSPYSNIDNYTTLSWNNISNLHETALISLLSVPGVAKLVG